MGDEEIKIPEFDEKKFKETERRKAKASMASFLFGILIAIISVVLWIHMDKSIRWPLVFLFAMASIGFLAKILQFLKIDISSFSKKEWLSSISFYFFTWLAFFILFINPPFYDASPPKIEVVVLPAVQQINENASIFARITDNVGISKAEINLSGLHEMKKYNEFYVFNYSGNNNEKFRIVAKDKNGHESSYEGMLYFEKNVIYATYQNNSLNSSSVIKIWVLKNISEKWEEKGKKRVRVFCIVNGKEVNATYLGEEGRYYIYKTMPSYEGWKSGKNKMQPCAEVIHYMKGSKTKLSAIVKGEEYEINVENDSNVATLPSPGVQMIGYSSLRTPAFEVVPFAMAIVIAVLLRRKKK